MATLVSTLNTEFTPAVGVFVVQVTGGSASLMKKNTPGAAFSLAGNIDNENKDVENSVAGAVFKFDRISGTPVVQADQ